MEWIIPCNVKYYDVLGAFAKLSSLNWKQSIKNIAVNDTVYIYVGAPHSAILYKCLVTKINLTEVEIDDQVFRLNGDNYDNYGKHMELQLLQSYPENLISKEKMAELGVKGRLMGPRSVIPELKRFLDSL